MKAPSITKNSVQEWSKTYRIIEGAWIWLDNFKNLQFCDRCAPVSRFVHFRDQNLLSFNYLFSCALKFRDYLNTSHFLTYDWKSCSWIGFRKFFLFSFYTTNLVLAQLLNDCNWIWNIFFIASKWEKPHISFHLFLISGPAKWRGWSW